MDRSHGLMRCAQMGVRLSSQQQANILHAEANGLTFCCEFGYNTPRERINAEILLKSIKEDLAKKERT